MTDIQKQLWDRLPVGEWVKRDDMDDELNDRHRTGHFQRSLSWLYNRQMIELEFRDGVQYMRRKTMAEIQQIPLEILNKKR
jgi:hypothetical protein